MIIGTAGHIDHGKTSLVRALTGVDTDRLIEEKRRGISIDLGFAYLPTPEGSVLGFVDVPGHEKFIHNMLAGATGIDFALFVVAADDGIMPQSLEHLAIVDLLAIRGGVVALTKIDLAAPARRAEVAANIARALEDTCLSGSAVVPVSTVTGEGIDELRARLLAAARTPGTRAAPGRFRLAVDRSFSLTGAGTIVTGTVLSGTISVGERVVVSPSGLAARVRSIHAHNRPAERGQAGDRCALNLAGDGVSKAAIMRGDVVLDPELHAPADRIDATLRLLPTERTPISQWMPVRLHHAAVEVGARVVLLRDAAIPPGCEGRVQLVLERPIAAACGDRFVLRDTSARRTIGGGRLLDLRAPARKRRTSERHAKLDAHAIADSEAALAALLDQPPHHVDLSAFGRDRALAAAALDALSERLDIIRVPASGAVVGFSAAGWMRLKRCLAATLEIFHAANPDLPGMTQDRLRLQIEPPLRQPEFSAALQVFARAHEIALDGAWVRLPGHARQLRPEDEELWTRIKPLLAGNDRFRPPRVGEIAKLLAAPEAQVRRLLKLLSRIGAVDEVAPDHFFLRAIVAEMVGIASDIATTASDRRLTAAQFRDRLDNGRKVAIQILEFFDRHGVTLRSGDLRRMNPQRIGLFGPPAEQSPMQQSTHSGRESSPVGRPDFKSGRGRQPVFGGFDPHSLPPGSRGAR